MKLYVNTGTKYELKATAKLFFTKRVCTYLVSDFRYLTSSGGQFLLIVPLIAQAVFPESFNGTYLTRKFARSQSRGKALNSSSVHFSVRARALGSFLSAVIAIIAGNILGVSRCYASAPHSIAYPLTRQWFLDRHYISLKTRARSAFAVALGLQGCWWAWSTYIQVSLYPD